MKTFNKMMETETDECIEWPFKSRANFGYGVINIKGKPTRVHIMSCQRHHGPRPSALHEVAHSCDNPPCFNYRHLRWATRQENVDDCIKRGRWTKGKKS